jgi:hemoglobin-like flavoprotein
MQVNLKLRIAGKGDGLRIPIDRLPFLIGRDPLCHLRPASLLISQHHCALWTRGDQLLVRDLGSTNGTYLNNRAVTGEQQAVNGDTLKIGPLLFDVCIKGSPSLTQPTPSPPKRSSTRSTDDDVGQALAFRTIAGRHWQRGKMDMQQSLASILDRKEPLADLFYSLFFDEYPEVRQFYVGVSSKRQAVLLAVALQLCVQYYAKSYPAIAAYLKILGEKQQGRGILREDYPKFRTAMVSTLSRFHGNDWNNELAQQWNDAIELASNKILEGYAR